MGHPRLRRRSKFLPEKIGKNAAQTSEMAAHVSTTTTTPSWNDTKFNDKNIDAAKKVSYRISGFVFLYL